MKELSLLNILTSAISAIVSSKVILLIVLELMVLLANIFFSKLMNKKLVNITCLVVSLILLGFYSLNYLSTLKIFIDNVSTRAVEIIYFPTTLEFVIVMILSIAIMITTLASKKANTLLKAVNVSLPLIISFIFLCIIETVNKSGIDFSEFSVFTDTTLMSLHELAMGSFVAWIFGLIIYKVDVFVLSKLPSEVKVDNTKEITNEKMVQVNIPAELKYNTVSLEDVYEINNMDKVRELLKPEESLNDDLDDLELPKLKTV